MERARNLKKLITPAGLKQFLKILNKKEKTSFLVFLLLGLSSLAFLCSSLYLKNTEIKIAQGGTHIEGVIGSPRYINPIYAQADDVDRDLTELIYSGLMKHNKEGEIIADLAESYKIIEEGKIFEFHLKENLFWSDKNPLTVDDIIFTIKSIQNPSLKSPIRASWFGVKTEKISDLVVRFELRNPSAVFLENCTLKILPKHIWENISEKNFYLSAYNLRPIGSGPYKIKEINQDKEGNIKSLELTLNPYYYKNSPHIPKIIFSFFDNKQDLISAFNSGQIKGLSVNSSEKKELLKNNDFSEYQPLLPRYFAVFFNSKISKEIKQALNYGTDKEEIISQVLLGQGTRIDSPIMPDAYQWLESPLKIYEFDLEKAKQILDKEGFLKTENGLRQKAIKKEPSFQFKNNLQVGSRGSEVQELQKCLSNPLTGGPDIYPEKEITGYFGEKTKAAVIRFQEKYKEEILQPYGLTSGNGIVRKSTRAQLNQLCAPSSEETTVLSFTLTTFESSDTGQPILTKTANLLKKQWELLGFEIKIEVIEEKSIFLEEIIRLRDYEMVLFGNALGSSLDPFPFWHSSQVKDPGLNLAEYENKKADSLLELARQTLDEKERKEALEKFQNILIEDAPAVFLYSPDYLYLISKEIKGFSNQVIIDPSKRFSNIEDWYIKTKRAWK
jgi:ABC-type transport system substrate-binding protein